MFALHRWLRRLLTGASLAALALNATAEPRRSAAVAPFQLDGTTLDGGSFSAAATRGKVLLVVFWRTDCAVCRSKMPELRANYEGWRSRPLEMVGISVDRSRDDALAYVKLVDTLVPPSARFPMLWAGESGYRTSIDVQPHPMPLTLVIDAQGRVVRQFEGRIAAEAWDTIADLLP